MSKNKGKASKNAIENRGVKTIMTCTVCNGTRKPIRTIVAGKMKMLYECKCGYKTKIGDLVSV